MTGAAIAEKIIQFLRDECKLDMNFLHGQAYDAGGAMAGTDQKLPLLHCDLVSIHDEHNIGLNLI